MLSPKRVKYRKIQKGNLGGKATRGNEVSFGQYGLQALAPGRITAQQIEAARVAMTRYIKRGGKIWIRIFPTNPSRKSPPKHAWGRKRPPEGWIAIVKPGTVMYEMEGVTSGRGQGSLPAGGQQAAHSDEISNEGYLR